MAIFGLIFFAAGALFFWFIFLSPALQWNSAKNWPSVEGKIVNSHVETHHGDDSTTYSAEFEYEYVVEGQKLSNDRYSFFQINGSRGKANALIAAHPVGSKTQVYYDPNQTSDSVMTLEFPSSAYIGFFVPLIFVLVGGTIFVGAAFFGWAKPKSKDFSGYTSAISSESVKSTDSKDEKSARPRLRGDMLDEDFDGPLILKPSISKWAMFFGLLGVCIFWNGIVSLFLYQVVDEGFPIFLSLFMIPFVLVGLVLTGAVIYCFLALFNPKIEIALSNGAIPLGGEFDLAWEVIGNATRFQKLKIWVEGEEAATYRQGTDTRTDTNTFQVIPAAEVTNQSEIQFGTASISIPEDTCHTFKSDHNEIKWTVKVHGDIPYWPDVNSTLEFRVKP